MGKLLRRLRYFLRQRQIEDDLAAEMEFHRAMSGPAAFGNTMRAREDSRSVWIWPWLQDALQDVRFAARLLATDLRFSASAIVALALGIAANTTTFTFINAVLFKDLPFDRPYELVALGTRDARGRDLQVSYPDFEDWRRAARAFQAMSASAQSPMNVSEEGLAPQRLHGAFLSASAFDVLRVAPAVGRAFVAQDERPGAAAVLLIGYDVWLQRYGGSPAAIGREVRVNDVAAVIIGVMPRGFGFPMTAEAWEPLTSLPGVATAKRDARTIGVTARLRSDVTIDQARSELTAIAEGLARDYPTTNREITATVARPLENMRRFARPMLLTMLGAVAFVLLIGCANVATLMLARAAARAREIAIRSSLGATRWRIVRQLSIESVLLALVAGAAGLMLSLWSTSYFGVAFNSLEIGEPGRGVPPYWLDLGLDRTVFAFVAAVCLACSMLFGIAPALHISKTNTHDVLKENGRTASAGMRVRRWTGQLMIVELALALILLSGAGLLVRSFIIHYTTALPIETRHLIVARTELPPNRYATPQARKAFLERLDDRLAARAGVADAAAAGDIPLVPLFAPSRTLAIEGKSPAPNEKPPAVSHVYVGSRYFEAVGLRLVQGRVFTAADGTPGQDTAIVSQRFATMYFPGETALGNRIRLQPAVGAAPPTPWMTIVGIAPTIPETAIRASDPPLVYLPLRGETTPGRSLSIIVRSDAGAATVGSWLRNDLRALDPDLPLYYVQPLDALVAQTRYPLRMMGVMFGLLAVIGVVLVSVGLAALTAHGVAQRRQEIGVRMALGARVDQVIWMFLRRTLVQLVVSFAIGLAGALWAGQLIQRYLFRTQPRDPLTLASICVLLAGVAIMATLFPARRAARIDPAIALRCE